jgi:tRNA(adenine34) deaminase
MNHEDFMRLAFEQAKLAKVAGDLPFGAVVVQSDKVVGKGRAENNTIGDVTDHAELLAVREACKTLGKNNLSDCVIYCSNEPCIMCAAGIFQANIPKVVIGVSRDNLPNFLRARKVKIDHIAEDTSYKVEIIRGVLKVEILPLFDDIQKK